MSMDEAQVAFTRLADRIYAAPEVDKIPQAIVETAVDVIDGCDHACVMLIRGGHIETAAASDDIARLIDDYEKALGEGPCLDAIASEAYQHDADLTTGSSWPQLTKVVLETTPVRGMIGYRLLIDGRKVGALNLFSDTAGALTAASADTGTIMAAFASMALMTGSARQEAADLRAGLMSNREIGKAVGLLMAAHQVTQERAFDLLVKTSRDLNVKLSDVAARVVAGQEEQFRRADGN